MTYEKALEVLKLKPNFTEKELKKAYRKMLNQYHPDVVVNCDDETKMDAEKKIKDITVAYSILLDYLTVSSDQDFDIDFYKGTKINALQEKIKFDFDKYKDISSAIEKIIKEIQGMIMFNIIRVQCSDTKKEIDEVLERMIFPELAPRLENLRDAFYKQYNIKKNNVKISLDYSVCLQSFYDTLLKIKEATFIEKIDTKLLEYINYSGYNRVKYVIEKIRCSYIDKIKKGILIDINDMNQEILDVFNTMHACEKRINNLITISSNIEDSVIRQKFEELQSEFQNIESFSNLQKNIEELENLVKESNRKQNRVRLISQYYGMILNWYTGRLQQLTGLDYLNEASMLSKIFQKIVDMLQNIQYGRRSLDDLELLSKITFYDYEKDLKLLDEKENTVLDDIYIINRKVNDESELLLGKVIKIDEKVVHMIGISEIDMIVTFCLSLDSFVTDYILFEDFLEKYDFCGYKCDLGDYLLYFSDYVSLYYDSKYGFYFIGNTFKGDKTEDNFSYSKIQVFQDKELLKKEIVKFLNHEIKKWEDSEGTKKFTK